jgi:hypothetical protein
VYGGSGRSRSSHAVGVGGTIPNVVLPAPAQRMPHAHPPLSSRHVFACMPCGMRRWEGGAGAITPHSPAVGKVPHAYVRHAYRSIPPQVRPYKMARPVALVLLQLMLLLAPALVASRALMVREMQARVPGHAAPRDADAR